MGLAEKWSVQRIIIKKERQYNKKAKTENRSWRCVIIINDGLEGGKIIWELSFHMAAYWHNIIIIKVI